MSVEAITWALRQPITHSSAKFVLVVLANCASADSGLAFPSIAYLASATGQDRKTVVANLARLQEWGLIEDSGERRGTTKQIVVYRVLSGPDLFAGAEEKRNSSENGTVPKSAGNSTVFPGKGPKNGTRNHQKPSGTSISGAGAHDDFEGSFEGHDDPPPAKPNSPNAAGEIAVELRRLGYRVTSHDPTLLAAIGEGVTLDQVLEFARLYPADHAKCRGSPGYVLSACRRQRAESVDPAPQGNPHAARHRPSSSDRVVEHVLRAQRGDDPTLDAEGFRIPG